MKNSMIKKYIFVCFLIMSFFAWSFGLQSNVLPIEETTKKIYIDLKTALIDHNAFEYVQALKSLGAHDNFTDAQCISFLNGVIDEVNILPPLLLDFSDGYDKALRDITMVTRAISDFNFLSGTSLQNYVEITPTSAFTNGSLVLEPQGTGALMATVPDGTAAGGNARGNNAVDWQITRAIATQIASGTHATIGGGANNTALTLNGTIGGGNANTVSGGNNTTVCGGSGNTASQLNATVCGGVLNTASGQASFLGGGSANLVSGLNSTIGGGLNNMTGGGAYEFIGGGQSNNVTGDGSSIVGGVNNSITGNFATIGGGANNIASGVYSTVVGGLNNIASGANSVAMGTGAAANLSGCFVWCDPTGNALGSSMNNQVRMKASGGYQFFTDPGNTLGVSLPPGGTAWLSFCDKNAKTNFEAVDTKQVVEKIAAMPITTWNYKAQNDMSIRHMGPMAQDLYEAFHLGHDDKHIDTLNADGVLYAAVQGLNKRDKELYDLYVSSHHELNLLKDELDALKARVEVLQPLK